MGAASRRLQDSGIPPAQPPSPGQAHLEVSLFSSANNAADAFCFAPAARLCAYPGRTYTEDTSANACTGRCLLTPPTYNITRIHIKPKYRQPSPLPPPWLLSWRSLEKTHALTLSIHRRSRRPQTPASALCLAALSLGSLTHYQHNLPFNEGQTGPLQGYSRSFLMA